VKTFKYLFAIAAVTTAPTLSAKADLMFFGAVPFGANNNPDTHHDALEAFLGFDPGPLTSHDYGTVVRYQHPDTGATAMLFGERADGSGLAATLSQAIVFNHVPVP
jgi:hypothetical protein